MSLFFRVRAFDVKGLFVVVFGTWFSNFGFICSKNRKGERSFECRMAPLTELIILCLHTVCDHPEPKLEPRLSWPCSEGKSLMQAGGVLFCIFCSETIFWPVSRSILKRQRALLSQVPINIFDGWTFFLIRRLERERRLLSIASSLVSSVVVGSKSRCGLHLFPGFLWLMKKQETSNQVRRYCLIKGSLSYSN